MEVRFLVVPLEQEYLLICLLLEFRCVNRSAGNLTEICVSGVAVKIRGWAAMDDGSQVYFHMSTTSLLLCV